MARQVLTRDPGFRSKLDETAEEVHRLVDVLLVAHELEAPQVFLRYLDWLVSMRSARGQPIARLQHELRLLHGELLRAREDSRSRGGAELVEEALVRLGNLDDETSGDQEESLVSGLSREYLDLLRAGRRERAATLVIGALDCGLPVRELYLDVFGPALREVGRLWETGAMSVAQEHYVSAATQLILSQLYPRLLDSPRNGHVLVACSVRRNLHEIGLRVVCDLFELDGWETHFLGADTELDSLVRLAAERHADVVAVSASLATHLPDVMALVRKLRTKPETRAVPVLVGGAVLTLHPDLWKKLGADGFARDADEAREVAQRLVKASTS